MIRTSVVVIAAILLWNSLMSAQAQNDGMILAASNASPSSPAAVPVEASSTGRQPNSRKTITGVSASSEGLIFPSADGADTLKVHGYFQVQDRMFASNTKGQELDTFLFRKIRPLFEGTLFNAVDFRFMPDFGQYNPQIQEAYLELKSLSFAKLRVGKFKEPIGLEALRQDRELVFPERSLATDLVPLRYLGAQLSGSIFADSITYSGGYFNGSSDGSNGVFTQWARANEGAGRIFLQPFITSRVGVLRGFGIGVAGSSGDQRGAIPGLKTTGQSTFFKYSSSVVANGTHSRISPQAYYYAGPIGLMGEYVVSSQDVLKRNTRANLKNAAWGFTGSIVLTGEKNTYGGIRLRDSFEPGQGFRHIGAVELAVRASQVRIDHDAFPVFASATTAARQATEYGIGIDWYLNRFVKLTTDYEHTKFDMATTSAVPLHDENVLMSQIQLGF